MEYDNNSRLLTCYLILCEETRCIKLILYWCDILPMLINTTKNTILVHKRYKMLKEVHNLMHSMVTLILIPMVHIGMNKQGADPY